MIETMINEEEASIRVELLDEDKERFSVVKQKGTFSKEQLAIAMDFIESGKAPTVLEAINHLLFHALDDPYFIWTKQHKIGLEKAVNSLTALLKVQAMRNE